MIDHEKLQKGRARAYVAGIIIFVVVFAAPPADVVPYKLPLVAWTSAASGCPPSVLSKLCRMV